MRGGAAKDALVRSSFRRRPESRIGETLALQQFAKWKRHEIQRNFTLCGCCLLDSGLRRNDGLVGAFR